MRALSTFRPWEDMLLMPTSCSKNNYKVIYHRITTNKEDTTKDKEDTIKDKEDITKEEEDSRVKVKVEFFMDEVRLFATIMETRPFRKRLSGTWPLWLLWCRTLHWGLSTTYSTLSGKGESKLQSDGEPKPKPKSKSTSTQPNQL